MNYYDVLPLGTTWWLWKDDTVTGKTTGFTTSDLTSVPTINGDRTDGPTTTSYQPSTGTPQPLTSVSNRMPASVIFLFSTGLTTSGKRVSYLSLDLYLTPMPGQTFAADSVANFRGVLQTSLNGGQSWTNSALTSGASFTSTSSWNGMTAPLWRNTWFRWYYPGDVFTAPAYSPVRLVRVIPVISAASTKVGLKFNVHGRVLRQGGVAILYRYIGARKVRVAYVPVGPTGLYSFGLRTLPRGMYQVFVPGGPNWTDAAANVRV